MNKFHLGLPPVIHVIVEHFTQNGHTVNFELVYACFLSNFHAQTACEFGLNFGQSYDSMRKISRKLIPSSANKFRANLTRCFRSKFHIGLHSGFGVHFKKNSPWYFYVPHPIVESKLQLRGGRSIITSLATENWVSGFYGKPLSAIWKHSKEECLSTTQKYIFP
jgi:hypothetical protein